MLPEKALDGPAASEASVPPFLTHWYLAGARVLPDQTVPGARTASGVAVVSRGEASRPDDVRLRAQSIT